MELLHLKIFVLAAKYLNFTRVADQMFISQPSISKYVATLEHELGEQLFYRISRNLILTDFGKAFLPYAKKLLEDETDLEDFIDTYKRNGVPHFVIGIEESLASGVNVGFCNALMRSLGQMRIRWPDTYYKIKYFNQNEYHVLLDTKKIDLALSMELPAPPSARHKKYSLAKSTYYLAISPRLCAETDFEKACRKITRLYVLSDRISRTMMDSLFRVFPIAPHIFSCEQAVELALKITTDEGAGIIDANMIAFMHACGITVFSLPEPNDHSVLTACWNESIERPEAKPLREDFLAIMSDYMTVETKRLDKFIEAWATYQYSDDVTI